MKVPNTRMWQIALFEDDDNQALSPLHGQLEHECEKKVHKKHFMNSRPKTINLIL